MTVLHSTSQPSSSRRATSPRSVGVAQLLRGVRSGESLDLDEHRALHGPVARRSHAALVADLEAAALAGRGGAAFPTSRKLKVTPVGPRTRVVVNGSESEPASAKDRTLMQHAPHLVLDGARLVASALQTESVVLVVHDRGAAAALRTALAQRADLPAARVDLSAASFVAGEAGAVVNHLNALPGVPSGRRRLPHEDGPGGSSFLSNVETFAQIAVIASMGVQRYRDIGAVDEPGTSLSTLVGGVAPTSVVEVTHGVPLSALIGESSGPILIGGYHGTWTTRAGSSLRVHRGELRREGIGWGAGVIATLPDQTCALGELAQVSAWLADQSARQCGPCAFGLPALARQVRAAAAGERLDVALLRRRAAAVTGRGACSHPDGSTRFILSGVSAFADDLEAHAHGGCGRPVLGVLPTGGNR